MREPDAEVRHVQPGLGQAGPLQDLLANVEERAVYVEIRHALARGVRQTRQRRRFSQQQLADLIGSSQPRVSMMEGAAPGVSVSLMIRTLIRLGARRADVARLLGEA